jgi:hypothetical protein
VLFLKFGIGINLCDDCSGIPVEFGHLLHNVNTSMI